MSRESPRWEEEGEAKEMFEQIMSKNFQNNRSTVIKIPIIFNQVK